jgi:restriction system protein
MAMWIVRTGRRGEHEQRFLDDKRIYLTWPRLNRDLSTLKDKAELKKYLTEVYSDESPRHISNNAGQISAFVRMAVDDLVLSPTKRAAVVHVGRVIGGYEYNPSGVDRYQHSHQVSWLGVDVPRSAFDKDIQMSLSSQLTVCRVNREAGEQRVLQLVGAKSRKAHEEPEEEAVDSEEPDLEELAQNQLARLIEAKYKGYEMALLVDAILRAQGYITYVSPPGPDNGVDILAGSGPMGFGHPRLVVQVKSQDAALGKPVLTQLVGTMTSVGADQGLLVCWGGFKRSIQSDVANYFFKVRLWDQTVFVREFLEHYDRLDDDIKAEIPLKRIWVVTPTEAQ